MISDYFLADGTDYFAVDVELVFRSEEVSKMVQIPLANDDIFPEANKTFEVYLGASPGVFISPIGYVSAIILNDDPPLPGLFVLARISYYV